MKIFSGIRFWVAVFIISTGTSGLRAEENTQPTLVSPPSYLLVKENRGFGLILDSFLKTSGIKSLYNFGEQQPFRVLEIPAPLKAGEVLARLQAAALISESAIDISVGNTGLDLLMRDVYRPAKVATGDGIRDNPQEGIPTLLQMKPGASLANSAELIANCGGKFLRAFGEGGQFQIVEISQGVSGFEQMVGYRQSTLVQSVLPAVEEAANLYKGLALDRFTVVFKEGTTPEQISKVSSSSDAESVKPIYPGSNSYRVRVKNGKDPLDLFGKLQRNESVERVDTVITRQIYAVPNDPLFTDGSLWGLRNQGENGGVAGVDMNAVGGWNYLQTSGVVVAIIDTGMRTTHEDLVANLWVNTDEIPGDGIDNDMNGYIDDIHGFNAEDDSGAIDDVIGHGTGVAGCVAASGNNSTGVVGTSWGARLMICKVGDYTDIPADNILACLDYAIKNGATVINCSFGGRNRTAPEEAKIAEARAQGIIVVAAAGNNGFEIASWDLGGNNDRNPVFPASYALDNIISVSSINRLGVLSGFSSYGTSVSISAPGEEIYTTNNSDAVKYAQVDGTSFSAPYVAGIVALAKQQFPAENYFRSIERILTRTKTIDTLVVTANSRKGIPDMASSLVGSLSPLNVPQSFLPNGGLPSVIPDGGETSSTIEVTKGGVIASLRLNLTTTHAYPADLYLKLTSPSGRVYTYAANCTMAQTGNGGLSQGLPFVLDDFPVWFFNGDSALGTWTLTMVDFWGGITGRLDTWSMDITTYSVPPSPGTLSVILPQVTATEESGMVQVGIGRVNGSIGVATVEYTVQSGSAVVGSDFENISGTVVFEPGETVKYVNIPIINDNDIEGPEAFYVVLSKAKGASLFGATTTTVVIPQNDLGFFNLSAASYSVFEGQGRLMVTVTRDSYVDTPAAVYFSTSAGTATPGSGFGGGDYGAFQGYMLFPAGMASQTFPIAISNDGQPELPENFVIHLSAPTQGASVGTRPNANVVISD